MVACRVNGVDECGHRDAAVRGDRLEALPKGLFETDAAWPTGDLHRAFDDEQAHNPLPVVLRLTALQKLSVRRMHPRPVYELLLFRRNNVGTARVMRMTDAATARRVRYRARFI